ncbi:MAG: peptidyl-prolyl cis-trans isomerase [Pseudomonadota bacterium]
MAWLARLNRPWVHFIIIGSLLFYLQGVMFPAPKPVVGPLNEARTEALMQQWFATTGRLPTEAQKARMIQAELDRDMLFQRALEWRIHEIDPVVIQRLLRNMRFLRLGDGKSDEELYAMALDMRLHLGDEVVKRRMIQVMEQLLLAGNPAPPITEQALAAEFSNRKEELRRPPRYSIEHIYFNLDRMAEVEAVVDTIQSDGLGIAEARAFSSPFLPGYRFQRQTPDQLARHFGTSFVENLLATAPSAGAWAGPVRSTYGIHYVWVSEVEPDRDATLEEVRNQLLRDLQSKANAEALRSSLDRLRADYEVRS